MKKLISRFIERGAIVSSSSFLAKKMIRNMPRKENSVILELGAGSGVFTKEILKKLPASGKLIAIEIYRELADDLKKTINDHRLQVICGSAEKLSEILSEKLEGKIDCVISGLPIGNFKAEKSLKTLREIEKFLHPDGEYIQFQYFLASYKKIKKIFPRNKIGFELRNILPAFVITSRKS